MLLVTVGTGRCCSLRARARSHLAVGSLAYIPCRLPQSIMAHLPTMHSFHPNTGSLALADALLSTLPPFRFQSDLPFLIESAVSKQLLSRGSSSDR